MKHLTTKSVIFISVVALVAVSSNVQPAYGDEQAPPVTTVEITSTTSTTTQKTTKSTTKKTTTTAKKTTSTPTTKQTIPPTTKQTIPPTTKRATTTVQRTTTTKSNIPAIRSTGNRNLKSVGGIVVANSWADNLQRLLTAARKDGLNLTGGGYRDPAVQIELRKRNCGTSSFSIYQKSPSLCNPPTARPGTSNHERGLAVDFRNCGTRSTACYKWLRNNGSKYGFYNLPSEPWHWSINGR